ncbi:hypothetical protein CU102_15525 [Phyllobacterium brassicacearum]|uniref:Uncharacterized protein n=1 Tax=Phyllobacterium brassicacearum TaxID=314235 RepID=A0A2P7BND8_9HYPH|nr:hypothetical protein CU102_15525 [Phyllobacterium brassicacearum]
MRWNATCSALDDCRALAHKCPHENVARHDYYYLSDYYQLALAGPAVFVSKIVTKDVKRSGRQASAMICVLTMNPKF